MRVLKELKGDQQIEESKAFKKAGRFVPKPLKDAIDAIAAKTVRPPEPSEKRRKTICERIDDSSKHVFSKKGMVL